MLRLYDKRRMSGLLARVISYWFEAVEVERKRGIGYGQAWEGYISVTYGLDEAFRK